MSMEMELPPDWHQYYKQTLRLRGISQFDVTFTINRLFYTFHTKLIDAIYYAKCVNWNAAYDPSYSAKTHIPMYWIYAEITFNFPGSMDPLTGNVIPYPQSTHLVPISCYGLMDVEVNAIKDWYKLSAHFEPCLAVRAALHIGSEVEVLLIRDGLEGQWVKGTVIDILIIDNNQFGSQFCDNAIHSRNSSTKQPVVEYLQIQTTNDAITCLNRYDERIRPLLQSQATQRQSIGARYQSQLLMEEDDDEKTVFTSNGEELLTPPSDIDVYVPPQHRLNQNIQNVTNVLNPMGTNGMDVPQTPVGFNDSNISNLRVDEKSTERTNYGVNQMGNQMDPNDATPRISDCDEETEEEKCDILGHGTGDGTNNMNHETVRGLDQELWDEFDPRNMNIMRRYQQDLEETMDAMQKLAMRHTVISDLFRPIHLCCPKHSYRKHRQMMDEREINMTVMERNDDFDYIEVKMIDTQQPELAEMRVYMTPQQMFQHCTTYFHFRYMKPTQNQMENARYHYQSYDNLGGFTGFNGNHDESVMSKYSPSRVHQYVQNKHLSTSPIRKSFEERQNRQINKSLNESAMRSDNPRSHLQDNTLRSVLHDISTNNTNDDDGGVYGLDVDDHEDRGNGMGIGNGGNAHEAVQQGTNWMTTHFRKSGTLQYEDRLIENEADIAAANSRQHEFISQVSCDSIYFLIFDFYF